MITNFKDMDIITAIKSGREIQTRNGKKARIICTDYKGGISNYPIIALITNNNGKETTEYYTKNGRFVDSSIVDDMDLVFKPVKVIKWINVYKYNDTITTGGCSYNSEEEANEKGKASTSYLCTKSIEIEL